MMALFYPGFSIRFYVAGQLWSRWRRKKTRSKGASWWKKVCNLGLLDCISSILEQKLECFQEQTTDITILFLNWSNFQRKVDGEFTWNHLQIYYYCYIYYLFICLFLVLGIIPIFCEELFSEIEVKRGQSKETEYQVSWNRALRKFVYSELDWLLFTRQNNIIAISLILTEILPVINYSLWGTFITFIQEKPSTSQNHCYGQISHLWVPYASVFNKLFQLAVVLHKGSMWDIHRKHTEIMGKILAAGKG